MTRHFVSSESSEQEGFVLWFRNKYPEILIFHTPNGEYRSITTAKKLKRIGVVPGVPDLAIPEWRCWIEMKRRVKGVLSDEQKKVIAYLQGIGDTVIVGYGAEDASRKIMDWRKTQ